MKAGWTTKRLGEVCAFDKDQGIHRGLPYVGMEHIESHTGRFIGSRSPHAVKSATFRFSSAHVLYGRLRPYLNKAIAPDFEGHCSTEIFPLKPSPAVDRQYLLYWLLADETTNRINETCSGARMPRADMNEVLEFAFPLPPLPEQRRIVALLDEVFSGLATAAANAERNLDNARELFESHLAEVFSRRGDGWVERRLDEVCSITSTLVDPREARYQDLTHVGAGNIESVTGRFLELKSAREEQLVSGKFLFDESMVLYSKIRPYLRKLARPEFGGLCSADMYPLAPNASLVTRDFLFYLLLTSRFTDYAIQGSARAGMPKVNREHLFAFSAWFPDIRFQRELAAILDASATASQQLVELCEQKQAALTALKRTLLQQAFGGNL